MTPRRMLMGLTPLAAALLASVAPAAAAVEAGFAARALPVQITLQDSGFWFHNIGVRAAAIDLEVRNAGKSDHALAIVGTDQGKPLGIETKVLGPGVATQLLLRLPAGQYELFSPVDHDRDHGLAAPMKIISPSPASRAGAEMNRVFYNY